MGIFSNLFNKNKQVAPQPMATRQIQPVTGKSHTKVFKVAGVTFNNRQNNLKRLLDLKLKGKVLNIGMQQYDYQGEPAINIIVNGLDIGNLHKEDVQFVINNRNRILAIKDLFISSFEENRKQIYYAKIKLIIQNKN